MKKVFKTLITVVFSLLLILIIVANIKLYYKPTIENKLDKDVEHQLYYLKKALNSGADSEMQNYFPEGYLFINALYGLAYYDFAKNGDLETKKIAVKEMFNALDAMNTEEAKSPFTQDLPIPYGAFYTGWYNLVLGKKLLLTPVADRDSHEVSLYKSNCTYIAEAIKNSKSPYPLTYSASAWPADVMMAVASLALYEQLFDAKYSNDIKLWLQVVKTRLDPATGLIPHSVDAFTGKSLVGARGSSQSLMLPFLLEIDSTFAKAQFQLYQKHFLTSRLGLPGIREYIIIDSNTEDVDSGPVIWGVGGASSIVGVRTMTLFKEYETAVGLRNSIELFGCPTTSHEEKEYLFGYMPMADAFIAWSNASTITEEQEGQCGYWRLYFQLYSLLAIGVLCAVIFLVWRNKRQIS